MKQISFLRALFVVFKKDLLLEWKTRTRIQSVLFFGILILLMFSFAVGPNSKILGQLAAGFFWLALLFSSSMSLSESLRYERDNEALDGQLLLGVHPAAVFVAKSLSTTLVLWLLTWIFLPICVALFDVGITGSYLTLALTLMLGCTAMAAPGTLYATLASYVRAKDLVLPLLLFPILIPVIIACVKATSLLITGDPMSEWYFWCQVLCLFNGIFWSLGAVLFAKILDNT